MSDPNTDRVHNTTHKNTPHRHIGLHHNTPRHNFHNFAHPTTFVPHTTYITPQQHSTSHNKVTTLILYVLRFKSNQPFISDNSPYGYKTNI